MDWFYAPGAEGTAKLMKLANTMTACDSPEGYGPVIAVAILAALLIGPLLVFEIVFGSGWKPMNNAKRKQTRQKICKV